MILDFCFLYLFLSFWLSSLDRLILRGREVKLPRTINSQIKVTKTLEPSSPLCRNKLARFYLANSSGLVLSLPVKLTQFEPQLVGYDPCLTCKVYWIAKKFSGEKHSSLSLPNC